MPSTLADVKIELSKLGKLEKLASGGQGKIYLCKNKIDGIAESTNVVKIYKPKTLEQSQVALEASMGQLILYPINNFTLKDRQLLYARTVWPQRLVYKENKPVGVVMPLIPDDYYFDIYLKGRDDYEKQLFEIQYLIGHKDKLKALNVPQLTEREKVGLIVRLVRTVMFLHEKQLVIGDLSANNIVVTNPSNVGGGRPRAFWPRFIDIDSFRFVGSVPALEQGHTPGWKTPERKRAEDRLKDLQERKAGAAEISKAKADLKVITQKSDIFKLGLLIQRLFHSPESIDDDVHSIYSSESADKALFSIFGKSKVSLFTEMLANDPKARPTASDAFKRLSEK
ncbi:hypothetical protein [Corynebacterium sp. CCM 9204]|uniref:hypothetical protein n=1 Tax=Corynebacterium sp. CCM 9204 TaxID=3057616 RepID=UPI003525CAF0